MSPYSRVLKASCLLLLNQVSQNHLSAAKMMTSGTRSIVEGRHLDEEKTTQTTKSLGDETSEFKDAKKQSKSAVVDKESEVKKNLSVKTQDIPDDVSDPTKPKSLAKIADSLKKNKKIVIPAAVLTALAGIYLVHAKSEKNKIAHATALDLLEQYINTDETRRLRGAN